MVRITYSKRLTLLAIALMLFMSPGGASSGTVLCVMPGGQMTFADFAHGCCEQAEAVFTCDALMHSSGADDDHHCGSCFDIPLPSLEDCIRSNHRSTFAQVGSPSLAAYSVFYAYRAEASMPDSHHHKTLHLASVRSVTLRI